MGDESNLWGQRVEVVEAIIVFLERFWLRKKGAAIEGRGLLVNRTLLNSPA